MSPLWSVRIYFASFFYNEKDSVLKEIMVVVGDSNL